MHFVVKHCQGPGKVRNLKIAGDRCDLVHFLFFRVDCQLHVAWLLVIISWKEQLYMSKCCWSVVRVQMYSFLLIILPHCTPHFVFQEISPTPRAPMPRPRWRRASGGCGTPATTSTCGTHSASRGWAAGWGERGPATGISSKSNI